MRCCCFFLFDLRITITQANAFLLDQPIDCKRKMGKKTLFATSGRLGLQNDMLHMTSCVDMGHYLRESTIGGVSFYTYQMTPEQWSMIIGTIGTHHFYILDAPKTIQYIVGDNTIKDKW